MKKITFYKENPIILQITNSLLNLPTPFSISYMWNFGFMLGMTLMLQIITGLVLSMNYIPDINLAFYSVIHITRDIEYGWLMKYLHMNGASLFFIFMYIHLGRGIYFNSYSKTPIVWTSGVLILLLSMMTAFLGYVLPWGQMSFWGATVITSMLSAIPLLGKIITTWVWGNFSVSQPTLNRFFSLHFILPFLIIVLILIHLMILHMTGSSNPLMSNPNYDKMKFFPNFLIKDMNPLMISSILMISLISSNPNLLGDVENFNQASPTTTPNHIQPEWYFLFAYAILRAIPSKLGGVLAMAMSILILLILCMKAPQKMNKKFSPLMKMYFWFFINSIILLTWIGANPVEPPFTFLGMILTTFYFMIVLLLYLYSLKEHNIFNIKEYKGMIILLFISSLLVISSNSWVMIWIFMEINTLIMCHLINSSFKTTNKTNITCMLYLMIQLLSSVIFLFLVTSPKMNMNTQIFTVFILLLKMGASPFHLWYMKTLSNMEMNMNSMILIMTWQKIIPVMLLSFIMYSNKQLILTMSLFSMIFPIMKMKKSNSMKNSLILSSLNNNSWLMLSCLYSIMNTLLYLFLYTVSLKASMYMFSSIKNFNNMKNKNFMNLMIINFNMASIPPSMMFFLKILIILMLWNSQTPKEIIMMLMIMACFFSFLYFKSSMLQMTKNQKKNQMSKHKLMMEKFWSMMILIMSMTSFIFLI